MDGFNTSDLGGRKVTKKVNNEINLSKEEIDSRYFYFL